MSDFLAVGIAEHLVSILFAILLCLTAFFFAYKLHYFKLPTLQTPYIHPGSCLELFILFMALQFFLFPMILYWGFIQGHEELKGDINYTGWLNILAIFGMGAILSAFFYIKRKEVKALFTSKKPFRDMGMGVISWLIAFPAALLISQILVLILTDFLGYTLHDQNAVIHMRQSLENPQLFLVTLLTVVFIVPILEEIIFRGFLQTTLRAFLPPFSAILISSALFALFHFSYSQGINNVNILISLFILALFLGYIRERQGNLLPAIALHATFNGISVAMIVLSALYET